MITWITTVGWSPFAVINPIWAYCKENDDVPTKIIIIYSAFKRIEKNLNICQRYISEILKAYKKDDITEESIILEEIINDSLELYADKLKNIIEREKDLSPEKIILDMTPGRKYMSAINVFYGYNFKDIPVQVFYLHLEESRYQDVPYSLTPIIKNELIDVMESTEIFSMSMATLSNFHLDKIVQEKGKLKDSEMEKEFLILSSINNEFNTKTKIRKFIYGNNLILQGHELDKILKGLITEGLIVVKTMITNNQKYKIYILTDKGKDYLKKVENNVKNRKMEVN